MGPRAGNDRLGQGKSLLVLGLNVVFKELNWGFGVCRV